MSRRASEIAAPIVIVVATVAVYLLGLRQAGFVWDDDMYVTSNVTLRTLDGLRRIWLEPSSIPQYYPLVHTTFWLEYRLFGLAPLGFHLVNALLHGAAAVLLGRVLQRLAVPGAILGAALFALHPVQVESVAWITERKNVLSAVFYFAAAYFLLRALGVARDRESREGRDYTLGVVLFVCALLSKSVTATLPAALLLVLLWKRGRPQKRALVFLAPLFVLGMASGLVTAWLERHHVGAEGAAWDLTFLDRCLIAGRAIWFYALKLLVPVNLTFIYPRWRIDAGEAWQYLFPLAAIAVAVVLWKLRERIGAGGLVAALYFAGTLFPALGFFNVFPMRYSFVADHFQYLAAAGPLALAGAALSNIADRSGKRFAGTIAAVVLGLLAILTWRQCGAYQNVESLWRDTLAKNPDAWMAHSNLGLLLAQDGRVAEGMEHYRESIRIEPSLIEPRLNLGTLLQRQGRHDEAIAVFTEAVSRFPADGYARYNLATALCNRNRYAESLPQFQEALRLRPDLAEAAYNLGTAYLQLGRRDEAERAYREAIRIRPGYGLAHNNLAAVLGTAGRADEARFHRIEGLRLRAWSLATHDDPRSRNGAEALRFAEQACRETGWSDALALDALAAANAEAGRFDQAVEYGEKAAAAARTAGRPRLVDEIARRVASYRARRPYRDPATLPRPGALASQ